MKLQIILQLFNLFLLFSFAKGGWLMPNKDGQRSCFVEALNSSKAWNSPSFLRGDYLMSVSDSGDFFATGSDFGETIGYVVNTEGNILVSKEISPFALVTPPLISSRGIIYLSWGLWTAAYSLNSLNSIWTYNTSANCTGLLYTTSALSLNEKLLLISYLCVPNQGNPESKILAADSTSGYILWAIDFSEYDGLPRATSDFVVDEQNAYINIGFAQDGQNLNLQLFLFCIDVITGRVLWQNSFGPDLQVPTRFDVQIAGPVLDNKGRVVSVAYYNNLINVTSFSVENGDEIWTFQDECPFQYSVLNNHPFAIDWKMEVLYLACGHFATAVNVNNGTELWKRLDVFFHHSFTGVSINLDEHSALFGVMNITEFSHKGELLHLYGSMISNTNFNPLVIGISSFYRLIQDYDKQGDNANYLQAVNL